MNVANLGKESSDYPKERAQSHRAKENGEKTEKQMKLINDIYFRISIEKDTK